MPNWAYNKVYFKTKEDFDKALALVKGENTDFDFNKVAPRPEGLDKVSARGFTSQLGLVIGFILEDTPKTESEIKAKLKQYSSNTKHLTSLAKLICSSKISATKGDTKEAEQLIKNYLDTGYFDWYAWSIENWGTKWNCSNTSICEEDYSIYFQTAWTPVIPTIDELHNKLNVPMLLLYGEEQITSFAGGVLYNNGEVDNYETDDLYECLATCIKIGVLEEDSFADYIDCEEVETDNFTLNLYSANHLYEKFKNI